MGLKTSRVGPNHDHGPLNLGSAETKGLARLAGNDLGQLLRMRFELNSKTLRPCDPIAGRRHSLEMVSWGELPLRTHEVRLQILLHEDIAT
jgi:hypothetical protein